MSEETKDATISLSECKYGHLYRIWSRNLSLGVFDGKDGFIGIREKFDHYYLDREFHWDTGPPYGTTRPYEDLGRIPTMLDIAESLGSHCGICLHPIQRDLKGWVHVLTGRYDPESDEMVPLIYDHEPYAYSTSNRTLFEYLKAREKELRDKKEGV